MRCPRCQYDTPGDVRFCGKCGTPLQRPARPFDPDKTETLTYSCGELTDGSLFAGRYLVREVLGRGGMGCVYRVLDTKLDEEIALKSINAEIASDAKIVERFRTELRETRKITHRNVCRLYDLGADAGSLFITMEYIPGEDLEAMVRRLGKLPPDKAYLIARQVADGLAEVHRLGIIHRDLKPKNIMIDREGEAKIMDFGLARTPRGVKLTEVGHVVGTPSFMSPEQINGETLDARSDLFALGVIMYYMLTGALPFEAESTLTLALRQKTYRPPDPHALDPRVPEGLGRIVLKCLEIDREKRFASAADLLSEFDRTDLGFDTYEVHVAGRSEKPRAARAGGGLWRTFLTGAAVVAALAAAGFGLRAFLAGPAPVAESPKTPVPVSSPAAAPAVAAEKPKAPLVAEPDRAAKAVPVEFVTKPSRATVFVDEVEMGLTDDTFFLTPGRHAVRIRKAGYQDLLASLNAEPGGPGPVRRAFTLVPQPPTVGTLNVTSEPSDADVFLNGTAKPDGRTPFVLAVSPGKLQVRVSLAGYIDQTEDLEVTAGETTALFCPLSPSDGTVDISSDPEGAEVWSGNELIGRTPFTRPLKPAVYKLRIVWKGRGERQDVVIVHPGESLPPLRYTLRRLPA